MKRFLTWLLAAVLSLGTLASCASDPEDTPETTAAAADTTTAAAVETEPAETELSDDLAPMSYDGYTFTILTSKSSTQHVIHTFHEATGDVLNDAMYQRTLDVEEKYDIVFADDKADTDAYGATTLFKNSVAAGDGAYDVAMLLEREGFPLTSQDYYIDMNTLQYVNLDKPYWNKGINDVINMGKETYLAYGSLVLGVYDMTHLILFNKDMQEDLSLESPYDLVLSGDWTLDVMAEMARAARNDANGDGVWGLEDTYGFVGGSNAIMMDFITASRNRTIDTDENGNTVVTMLSNPKIEEVFTKVSDIFWEPGFWYTKSSSSNNYYLTDTFFQTNQALFADHTFYSMIQLRDMESDFGVVPFPKYDGEQQQYGTMVEAGTRLITIPTTAKNPDLSGAVLETLNFLSYRDVMPAYYEVTLKQKVSRDDISARMLDLIIDSIYYDLGATVFNDNIKDGIFKPLFSGNKRNFVSYATKLTPSIEKAIAKAQGLS